MTAISAAPVAIGFGNPLRGDDGVGLRVIDGLRALAAREPGSLPPGTRLIAAGSPSLDLLATVREASALVLVDALDEGRRPGSVELVGDDRVDATVGRGAIGELLVAGRLTGCLPDAIALVGIQVAGTDTGVGLSAPVEAAVPAAVRLSCRELTRLATLASRTGHGGIRAGQPAEEVCA